MISERDPGVLPALQPNVPFRVEDDAGKPAREMDLHMRMLGHAAFVRCDRTAFAHTPPLSTMPKVGTGARTRASFIFDPQVEN